METRVVASLPWQATQRKPGIVELPGFGRIRLGFGAISALGSELSALGFCRPLVTTQRELDGLGFVQRVLASLSPEQHPSIFDALPAQPTVSAAEAVADAYRRSASDCIVALGGGVVIDACKAAAILVANPAPLHSYSGHPERIAAPVAPIVAVPTTSGTGSEVTRGAGIHPASGQREFGLRAPQLQPVLAISDPEFTLSLPARMTAGTGMDALGHCIEGFLSSSGNPLVDAIALDGMERAVAYVERAVADGSDREARWQMMMAALQGGIAISNGLGCAHALSMTFSDSELHHGALVTIALPAVLRFVEPCAEARLRRIAIALGTDGSAADAVAALNERLGLPKSIGGLGYRAADREALAAFACANYFNQTSPRIPDMTEYRALIDELLA